MVTIVAPLPRPAFMTTLMPVDVKERQHGDSVSSASLAVGRVDWQAVATRLRWVSITPLGRPVVPLE